MTTIVINEKTKKGKIILELMREMGIGKIISQESDIPNSVTLKAIRSALKGETIKCRDFGEYVEKTQ